VTFPQLTQVRWEAVWPTNGPAAALYFYCGGRRIEGIALDKKSWFAFIDLRDELEGVTLSFRLALSDAAGALFGEP